MTNLEVDNFLRFFLMNSSLQSENGEMAFRFTLKSWNRESWGFSLRKFFGRVFSSISSPKVLHPTKILLRKILQPCRRHDRFSDETPHRNFTQAKEFSGYIWSSLTNPTNFISACRVPSWGPEGWTWSRWDLLNPKLHRNPPWVDESRTWTPEVDLHLEFSLSGCWL